MYDLFTKYLAGEISEEEKKILFNELDKNPDLRKQAAEIQNVSTLFSLAQEGDTASEKQYRSFLSMRNKRIVMLYARKISGYAAAILLSVLCTFMYMTFIGSKKEMITRYQEFSTPPGQRARVLLADGTEVWLNANSTLRYPEQFELEQRTVELYGEAFFEVEHNREKPFVVKTNKMNVQVTGTKFNISAYNQEKYFIASLVEGRISVASLSDPTSFHSLKPQQQIMVSDSSYQISTFGNTDFLLWKEGVFAFDDMRLEEIIEKLELYYDVSIITKNKKLKDFRYTGKLRQRDGVESALKKLQIVYSFTYEKDDERNQITLN